MSNIYRVPLLLHHQGATANMLARLQLTQLTSAGFLNEWIALAELVDSLTQVHGPATAITTAPTTITAATSASSPPPLPSTCRW